MQFDARALSIDAAGDTREDVGRSIRLVPGDGPCSCPCRHVSIGRGIPGFAEIHWSSHTEFVHCAAPSFDTRSRFQFSRRSNKISDRRIGRLTSTGYRLVFSGSEQYRGSRPGTRRIVVPIGATLGPGSTPSKYWIHVGNGLRVAGHHRARQAELSKRIH